MSTTPESNRTTPDYTLPWHLGPHYHTDIYSRNGFVAETRPMQTPYAEANAEFIVRACNAYDDLLEALKEALRYLDDGDPETDFIKSFETGRSVSITRLRAALAKAEGR